jgi:hypothetical protein
MPSIKVNETPIDLGALAAPLDFHPSKIPYRDERSDSSFELSRTADPRLLELKLLGSVDGTAVRSPDRTATVHWGDCSESVRAGLKEKFRIGSPPPNMPAQPIATGRGSCDITAVEIQNMAPAQIVGILNSWGAGISTSGDPARELANFRAGLNSQGGRATCKAWTHALSGRGRWYSTAIAVGLGISRSKARTDAIPPEQD